MIRKEEVRKHYIFTTDHVLDDNNKMLKQYIEQLESENKALKKGQNSLMQSRKKWKDRYYKQKKKVKELKSIKDMKEAIEFANLDLKSVFKTKKENERLKDREQKLIEKLEKQKIRPDIKDDDNEIIKKVKELVAHQVDKYRQYILSIVKGEKNE